MNNTDFFEKLKSNPRPVVVDFWAPWCVPCRTIEPVMKKLGEKYKGQVDVWKVNADERPELLRTLKIYGIPTLVAFKDGQVVARRTGAASMDALAGLFEAALSGEQPTRTGLAPLDRVLRLVIGAVLLFLAFQNHFAGFNLLVAVAGGVIAFSAVYDRCPIYRAVSARLKEWLGKKQPDQEKS
jgi:thioredoxin 1